MGPAGLGAEQVSQLGAAVGRALADETLRKTWIEQGYDLWGGSAADLAAQQRRDLELWRGVTRGMRFD